MSSFSIVTPNYNMGKYLEKTILSVLDNLEDDDEYIIVDGNSTDTSLEIINKYSSRIKLICETDDGYADAIHKGFSNAKNEYYCWINSGDILLNGSIKKARELLNENYDLVYGNDLHIDEDDNIISYSYGKVRNFHKLMLYSGWTPLQDACFWRSDIYWRLGGINKNYKFAADYDFFLRLSEKANIIYSDYFFSGFRKHIGQKSISGKNQYIQERKKSQNTHRSSLTISNFSYFIYSIYFFIQLRYRTFIFLPIKRYLYKLLK
jgi:glycosyltransferase involved in cell wall biosynthesis